MDDLRRAAAGGGGDGSGEDDDGCAVPMHRLHSLRREEEAVTGGQQEVKGHSHPEQHGSDDECSDVRGIDQDDEDSDDLERLDDCLDAFTREDEEEEEEEEEEETKDEETGTSEANQQTYAAMAEIVVKQLPTGQRVVDLVGERLRAHWMGQLPEYKHLVVGLLDVQEVKDAILGWWGVLVGALVENSKKPPSSKRALAYEKKREEERFPKQQEFSSEPSIVRKALELGVDSRRVAHKLACSGPSTRSPTRPSRNRRTRPISSKWRILPKTLIWTFINGVWCTTLRGGF